MWQLGIVLASVASLSGAVGDALVRLSFVVEEKRHASHRRQTNRKEKGGSEEEEVEGAKGVISDGAREGDADGARSTRANKKPFYAFQEPASRSSTLRSSTHTEGFGASERCERGDGKRIKNVQDGADRGPVHPVNVRASTWKRPLYMRPLWLIGTCLGTVINSLLSIISLDFASAAVVTPFAGLHIFWNVILSRFVLQERVLVQHYVGSALILLGLLLVLCFGVHTPPPLSLDQLLQLYSQNTCLLYFSLSILSIAFCVYVAIVGRDFPEHTSLTASSASYPPYGSSKHGALELHVLAAPASSFSSHSPRTSLCVLRSKSDSEETSRTSCPSPSYTVPMSATPLPLHACPRAEQYRAPSPLSSRPSFPLSLPALSERSDQLSKCEAGKLEKQGSDRDENHDRSGEDLKTEKSLQVTTRQTRESGTCLAPPGHAFPSACITAGSQGESHASKLRMHGRKDDIKYTETFSARELCALVPVSAEEEWQGREEERQMRIMEQCRKLLKPGSLFSVEGQLVSSRPLFSAPFRRFCTAAVSGLCGGNTNVLMEHVMKVCHEETWGNLYHFKFFILLLLLGGMAVGQLLFLNVGLARYEALYVVPTTMSVLIVSSCFAEIALFINVLHLPETEFLLFAGGCFSIVVGIMVLSGASLKRHDGDRTAASGGEATIDVKEDDPFPVDTSSFRLPTRQHLCAFVIEDSPQKFHKTFEALGMEAETGQTTFSQSTSFSPPSCDSPSSSSHREHETDRGMERQEVACDEKGNVYETAQEGARRQDKENLTAGQRERLRVDLYGHPEGSTAEPQEREKESDRGQTCTTSFLPRQFLRRAWNLEFPFSSGNKRKSKGYEFLTGVPPQCEEDGCVATSQHASADASTCDVSSASVETISYSESRQEDEGIHGSRGSSPSQLTRNREWKNPHLLVAVSKTLREYVQHKDVVCGLPDGESRPFVRRLRSEMDSAHKRKREKEGHTAESDSGNSRDSASQPSTPDLMEKSLLHRRRGKAKDEGESERRLLERTSDTFLASRGSIRVQEVHLSFGDGDKGEAKTEEKRGFLTSAGVVEAVRGVAHPTVREKARREMRNENNGVEDHSEDEEA